MCDQLEPGKNRFIQRRVNELGVVEVIERITAFIVIGVNETDEN
jgi:hypothetical protein